MNKDTKIILGTVAGFVAGTFITTVKAQQFIEKQNQRLNLVTGFLNRLGLNIEEMEDRGIEIPDDLAEKIQEDAAFTTIALHEV